MAAMQLSRYSSIEDRHSVNTAACACSAVACIHYATALCGASKATATACTVLSDFFGISLATSVVTLYL